MYNYIGIRGCSFGISKKHDRIKVKKGESTILDFLANLLGGGERTQKAVLSSLARACQSKTVSWGLQKTIDYDLKGISFLSYSLTGESRKDSFRFENGPFRYYFEDKWKDVPYGFVVSAISLIDQFCCGIEKLKESDNDICIRKMLTGDTVEIVIKPFGNCGKTGANPVKTERGQEEDS